MRELDHKEDWVLKNWCFQIVVLERLLRVPWMARRSNQSILKEINLEYSLEGLMLKLKLQYFGHLMWKADSLEKESDAGKDWGQEKGMTEDKAAGWHHLLNGHELEQTPGAYREAWYAAVCGVTRGQIWLSNSRTHHTSLASDMFNLQILNHEYFPLFFLVKEKMLEIIGTKFYSYFCLIQRDNPSIASQVQAELFWRKAFS